MTGPMRTMGLRRGPKISGWAAFTRQQQGEVSGTDVDHFPALIPNASSSSPHRAYKQKDADVTAVRRGDINFMSVGSGVKSLVSAESDNVIDPNPGLSEQRPDDQVCQNQVAVEKLKGLYPWADKSLIEDILMGVGYDLEKASASLECMVETDSSLVSGISEALERVTTDECSSVNCHGSSKCVGPQDSQEPHGNGFMLMVPPEPEWEEDDVYLKHRKDGLRMSRAAGRHSRNAQNAYVRGDHHTARIMAMRSQQEYLAAEKLNAKAAAEILRNRNEKFDPWKLDLHGLHASEAVDALASRLEMIEYSVPKNVSASVSSSSGAKNCQKGHLAGDKQSTEVLSCLSRPSELQVITGTGVHSRGGASLPTAIKNFLIGKGYKVSEARAGVIAVRPKFRYS